MNKEGIKAGIAANILMQADYEDYELVFEYHFYQHFEYKIDGIEVRDGKIILKSKTKINKEKE